VGIGSSSTNWTTETVPPTVTSVLGVSSPRNTTVSTIDFTFSEAINAATLSFADLTLTRNGGANLLTAGQTIANVGGNTFRISNLAGLTGTDGAYVLTVIASGIQDPATNAGTGTGSTSWTADFTPPTVTSVESIASPRNTAVSTIDFTFSEAINAGTLTFADLTLTRNGGANLLTAGQTIANVGGNTFRISNLAGLTGTDGAYVLTVIAGGIQDLATNAGTGTGTTSWTADFTPPTVTSVESIASPRSTPVSTIDFTFSEAINVATLTFADLTLTRSGGANLLTVAQTISNVSGNTYRISNLAGLTGTDGDYVLTVIASGIQDPVTNPGTGTGTTSWTLSTTGLTVTSVEAISTPRNTAVSTVDFTFSTAINAATLDFSDLTLTRSGGANLLTAGQTISNVSGNTFRISNLAGLTAAEGAYVLTVNATGVETPGAVAGTGSGAANWTTDTTVPTVLSVEAVTTPRNTPVASLDFTFSEAINAGTLTIADLTLTRNGGANLLTGAQTIALVAGNTYRISNLAVLVGTDGDYVLTVVASGIQDPATNAGVGTGATSWTMDITPPTVTSVQAISSPRNTTVSTIDFTFSETINVATLAIADLTLTRSGGANLLTGSQTIALVSGNTFRISNLAGLTGTDGNYVLTVIAGGIADLAGNAGVGTGTTSWTMDITPPTVTSVQAITSPRNTTVSTVDFTFSEAINAATLDFNDLTLTRNGGANLLTVGQTIANVGGNTFRISNLAGLTGTDGAYVLTVLASGIQDLATNAGTGTGTTSWTADFIPPTVTSVESIGSPQITAVSTIDFTFSEAINVATLTFADLTLTRSGGANLLTVAQTITNVGGNTFRISNLAGLTAANGNYVLTVIASGFQDPATNAGTGTGSTSWTMNAVNLTVISVESIATPRNTAVATIDFTFSDAINAATLDFDDLTLTRNGVAKLLTAAQTITNVAGNTYRISNLAGLTADEGVYVLTVGATGVETPSAQAGTGSASTTWTMDTTAPTVTSIQAVTSPRNTTVGTLDFTFSEAIAFATLDFSDLTLTRNGGANLLTAAQTITNVVGNTYRIDNLAGLTATDGDYVLTVIASGVQDLAGNAGTGTSARTWTMDTIPPTVTSVQAIVPALRNTTVGTIDFTLSEAINFGTLTFADLTLTRNGGANLLTAANTISNVGGNDYRIGNLAGLTGIDGDYVLTVIAGGIQDLATNAGVGTGSTNWTADFTPPTVTSVQAVSSPQSVAVSTIDFTFSEAINAGLLDLGDLTLTRDGGANLLTVAQTIANVGGNTFRISNLDPLTDTDGLYVLTVSATGIQDLATNAGTGSAATSWVKGVTGLSVLSLSTISPDPRNTPVESIDVTFSKAIDATTFTRADLSMKRSGVNTPLTNAVTISFVSGTTYRIAGLSGFTGLDGRYQLVVNAASIRDLTGVAGTGKKSGAWTMDTVGPTISSLGNIDATLTIPLNALPVAFNESIDASTLSLANFTLTRNGGANLLTGAETITGSGRNYVIRDLSPLTGLDGDYVLTVDAAGVEDLAGNPGGGQSSRSWTMDSGPGVTSISTVTPNPRETAVDFLDVTFSKAIDESTFDPADLSLTRDGGANLLTGAETITLVSGTTYRVGGLAGLTGAAGTYRFVVDASGVTSVVGTAGVGSKVAQWTLIRFSPKVTAISAVSPNPRNNAVDTIDVTFTEPIDASTFDFSDLTLTREGGANLITAAQTVALVSGNTWRISGLAAATGASGKYVLTVSATGIQDVNGVAGFGAMSTTWTMDSIAPTIVQISAVVPSPRTTPPNAITVKFSEVIAAATVDLSDFTLTLNAAPISLAGATITALTSKSFQISGLAALTGALGDYVLSFDAAGVQDVVGNNGVGSQSTAWTLALGPLALAPLAQPSAIQGLDLLFSRPKDVAALVAGIADGAD
jgi:hypothetical protein